MLFASVAYLGVAVTIYRLYTENGNRAGFWVQHRSWGNLCAQVESIAGRSEGKLPDPPTDDCAAILMRVFDVRSGRRVDTPPAPAPDGCHDRNYARIAEPFWSHAIRDLMRRRSAARKTFSTPIATGAAVPSKTARGS